MNPANAEHAIEPRRCHACSAGALAVVAFALRLGPLLSHRDLGFEDGVYGASVVGMRHGLVPYRDLFSSQGPLQYPLLFAGDVIAFHAWIGPRVVPVLAGIATPIAVWAIARRLNASTTVAVVAGLLVATSGSMLWTTGPVTADGPAQAFTAAAIYAALLCRSRPAIWRAVLAGSLLGAALATKPLMFPVVVPIAIWIGAAHRRSLIAATATAAAGLWLVTALPFGLSRVIDQSIVFHLDKHRSATPLAQFETMVATLLSRDIIVVVAVAFGLLASVARRKSAQVRNRDATIIGIWLVLVACLLVLENLTLPAHVATLVVPLALLFAVKPAPLRALAIACIALIPLQTVQVDTILLPGPYHGASEAVVDALQATPPRSRAISDAAGFVWEAGRGTPRLMNDPSNTRIETHRLTTAMVASGAASPNTCAVIIWSYRFATDLPGLREHLRREHFQLELNFAPDKQLWERPECRPRAHS